MSADSLSAAAQSDFAPSSSPSSALTSHHSASPSLSSIDPTAVSSPAISPRWRATSVPIRDEIPPLESVSAAPLISSSSPSSSSSSSYPLLQPSHSSLPVPPPIVTSSVDTSVSSVIQSSFQPSVRSTSTAIFSHQTSPASAPPVISSSSSSAPPPSLDNPPLPPTRLSTSPVRLLLPSLPSLPLSSIDSSSLPSYHLSHLLSSPRSSLIQGELLQLYCVIPHALHSTFPWLWDDGRGEKEEEGGDLRVTAVEECKWRVEVRLKAASLRGEERKEEEIIKSSIEEEAKPPLPILPTSLHLSSSSSSSLSSSSSESAASAPAVWSRLKNRFNPKTEATSSLHSPPPTPLISALSAPSSLDPSSVSIPLTRRSRSCGVASPSHIPPSIVLSSTSAFLHQPSRGKLSSSPIGGEGGEGGGWIVRLSSGDVVVVVERVMMATVGLLWLEVEVHSSPSPPLDLTSPSALRSFIADHRILRLPPPLPVAGALVKLEAPVEVESRAAVVGERIVVGVEVKSVDEVKVESCDVLLQSTRWVGGKGGREVSVPLPLSTLLLLSSHPTLLPLHLQPSDSFNFLFFLSPVPSLSSVLSSLSASLRSSLLHHPSLGASYDDLMEGQLLTSLVLHWRLASASTSISSQHEMTWQLPLSVRLREGGGDSLPSITLQHPPVVRLHEMFTVHATIHNTAGGSLTFILHILQHQPKGSEGGTAVSSSCSSSVVFSSSSSSNVAASQSSRVPPLMTHLPSHPLPSSASFSPLAGYHFPFQSFTSTPPLNILHHRKRSSMEMQHNNGKDEEEVKAADDEDGGEVGVLCLESSVEVGLLSAGGHRTIPLQWLAMREGFLPLHRLILHVIETGEFFCTESGGQVLVEAATVEDHTVKSAHL